MSRFIEIGSEKPNLKQTQIAEQSGYSGSRIKTYGHQIDMPSHYFRKTTKRKKIVSQDGSISVEAGSASHVRLVNS